MWTEAGRDEALEELAAAEDSDELCRLLLRSPWGWGSSTRQGEAVHLLRAVHGRGTLPGSFAALLLCTCRRWSRVTAKLIAAIEDSGMLTGAELDELAESLLSDEVDGETMTRDERRPEPPLRRWAAARALRDDPARLDDLLHSADILPPRHRDALLHGLLDAADHLEPGRRRLLVRRGLRSGIARVRRAALDLLCELDGPEAARRRARCDADRTVRDWHPPGASGTLPATD